MKKKTIVRSLLAVLCLVLALTVFVACGEGKPAGDANGPDTTGGAQSGAVKASDYALVYAATADEATTGAATRLAAAVTEKLGASLKSVGAEADSFDPNAYEILIGSTARAESATALEALNGKNGYVVAKINNKLVINATSPELLDEAVSYFISEYAEKGADGAFATPAETVHAVESASIVSLMKADGKTDYKFVIGAKVDTTEDTSSTGADKNRTDYVVQYFLQLRVKIEEEFGVQMDTITDATSAGSSACEILLGRTSRPETEAFLKTLAPNEYGYAVVGNKLVVTGWSDWTIRKAIELFLADFDSFVTEDGKNLVMDESAKKVVAYDLWNVSIPLYNDGNLGGAVEAENDSYELYYSDTSKEAYDAYCASLVTQGYQLAQENHIGDNYYATYTNGTTLIHVYYVHYLRAVRLVTESHKTALLPQLRDPYEKVTDTKMTLVDLDTSSGAFGNAFIITLEDGSFIFHDGGNNDGNYDDEEIWSLLNRINERPDGKIVIAAWILSHEHGDHFQGFLKVLKDHYRDLTLEKIIYNVPVESFDYNTGNPTRTLRSGEFAAMKVRTGCEMVRMHTGQKIQIRNLTIEVMYTWEDIYPEAPHHFNNSAFVTRFDIGEGENKQRLTILGDIEDVGSYIFADMYGDYLKTDILQVAHHGWGGTVELYALFKPTVVFWPTPQSTVNSQLNPSQTGYYPVINQSLINQKNVILLIVADKGHKTFPLPLIGLSETDENWNQQNFVTVLPREDGRG